MTPEHVAEMTALFQPPETPPPAGPANPTTPDAAAEALTAWAERVGTLRTVSEPGAIDTHFAGVREALEAKHRIDGLLVAPAEIFDQLEGRERTRFDEALRTEAAAIATDAERLAQALDTIARQAETLRPPVPTTLEGRAITRTAELLERAEVRRLYAGRPVRELLAAYEGASDEDAPAFVAFVEIEAAQLFRTIEPRTSEAEDADAVQRFTAAIRARQAARVPALVKETRARLAAQWTPSLRALVSALAKATPAAQRFTAQGGGDRG